MSTISFTSGKQGVQDLLAALPTPATPTADRSRGSDLDKESRSGFSDLLRDSSESQQAPQVAEPVDVQPSSETQRDDQASGDKPEAVDQGASANESLNEGSQQASGETVSEQNAGQGNSESDESQVKETADEAQVQAEANAAVAQLSVVDAVASDQAKAVSQLNTAQQTDLNQVKQATEAGQASAKSHASGTNLFNAALPNQAQSQAGTAVQADSAAVVQPLLQQGDSAQTNSGDAGGDNKSASASSNVTTSSATNANASAATAFTLPDQVASESRLPMQNAAMTQSIDAARQAQAQSAVNATDDDSLNTSRLTRGLANAVQQRGGAVTLRLTPPEMGTVRIQMQITGTSVSATFHAESSSAQTLLTTQLAQLRSSLESKGMSVDRLSVQPLAATHSSQNTNQSQNQGQGDSQQQGQGQQQSANDGRSRGQYSGDTSGQQSSDQQQGDSGSQQARRGFFDRLSDASETEAATL